MKEILTLQKIEEEFVLAKYNRMVYPTDFFILTDHLKEQLKSQGYGIGEILSPIKAITITSSNPGLFPSS